MRQVSLRLHQELVVDNFAGGGGASLGIEWALGRAPDIAVNHDPEAIAMHAANHPETRHYCEGVWDIDPRFVTNGRRVGLAWFSPDCTFHSKARGGQPFRDRNRARRRRGLAWVVVRWAKAVRPRVIILENVEEFEDWGPLLDDGTPCPLRRGATFRRWWATLENLGYRVESRQLRACDYGAPTTRRRLFIIARCDGQPIAWPETTHGPGLQPYRVAAECISWDLPCPSIFDRGRPLAEKTLARIARGIKRYVIDAAEPFLVPYHSATSKNSHRVQPIGAPLPTIDTSNRFGLVSPTLIQQSWGERKGQAPRALDIQAPLGTVVGGGIKHALVSAFLAKHYGGHEGPGSSLARPIDTITVRDHHALVRAFLTQYNRTGLPELREPLHTVTTRDRFNLVTVHGTDYVIADIGMRMLVPRELFRAQSFPDTYQIDIGPDGEALSKTAQVRMCGNSVPPVMAQVLVAANYAENAAERRSA